MSMKTNVLASTLAALTFGWPIVATAQTAPDAATAAPAPALGSMVPMPMAPMPMVPSGQMGTMPMFQMMPMMGMMGAGTMGQASPSPMGMMPMMPMSQMMPMMVMMGQGKMDHGMLGGGMMGGNMMGGNMMGHGGPGMAAIEPRSMDWPDAMMVDHIEGRIAFLRAELKITEAQAVAWEAFANVMRENAKRIAEIRSSAPAEGEAPPPLDARLGHLETRLAASLEGVRALRPALGALLGVLSEDQRNSVDELLIGHIGLMPGGPSTMGMNRM